MPTRLTRISENDWQALEHIRKQLVKTDGENRTMADAVAHVVERYNVTSEALFEMAKAMVQDVLNQATQVAK